jgi:hypothetical protein
MLRWKKPVGTGARPYTAFVGYVQENTIKFDYAKNRTEFTAVSLSLVLNKLDVFGSSLAYRATGPYTWNDVRNMDLDSAVAAHLRWKTTVLQIADVRPITNTYAIQKADFARGGGFSPVRDFLKVALRGDMVCDAQGTLWCERDQNTLALASRKGTSYIIEREDWRAEPQVDEAAIPDVSYMEVGGLAFLGATGTFNAYLSSVPGPVPDRYGSSETVEGLSLPSNVNSQTWLNEIAGFIYADRINRYPRIQIPVVGRWTKADIAPQQWAQVRGFPYIVSSRIQVSRIRHIYNARQQHVLSDLEAFAEAWGPPGFSKQIPVIPPGPINSVEPPIIIPPIPPTVTPIVLAMNYSQLGRSTNFYASEPTIWTNLKIGALANPAVGDFCNLVLSLTGEAWLITGAGSASDTDGLWYCSDTAAAVPLFSLIVSHNQAIALDGVGLVSLGCGDDGIVYSSGWTGNPQGHYLYGKTGLAVATGPTLPVGALQYSISSGVSVRLALGAGGVPAIGVRELDGAANANVLYVPGPQGDPSKVATGFIVWSNNLYSYVDGGATATLVYTGVGGGPIISDGGNVLTVRASDGMLMNGASALDTPLHAFGIANRSFASFCLGTAGYGELLACAVEGAAANFIIYRATGETEWVVKDGDWVAKMGANWAGRHGAGHYPTIVTQTI